MRLHHLGQDVVHISRHVAGISADKNKRGRKKGNQYWVMIFLIFLLFFKTSDGGVAIARAKGWGGGQ